MCMVHSVQMNAEQCTYCFLCVCVCVGSIVMLMERLAEEVDGCRLVTDADVDCVRSHALKMYARGQSVKCMAAQRG